MASLQSIPKRAIVSIQQNSMSAPVFMNVNSAKEMLNSGHVGGKRRFKGGDSLILLNTCLPGTCAKGGIRTRKNKSKRRIGGRLRKSRKN
jgi:hypothetical protein